MNQTLHPVILSVPEEVRKFKPKDRVIFLSRHARCALERSAEKSGIRLGELLQDDNGAPLPVNGAYWSITHKTQYVAGIVAPAAIGIDIEKIRSCSPGLFSKTAGDREWALAKTAKASLETFFRFWTSKEAVLKACGTGLRDLRQCRVRKILDASHLEIRYEDANWLIEHFFFDGHIASSVKNNFSLDWTVGK